MIVIKCPYDGTPLFKCSKDTVGEFECKCHRCKTLYRFCLPIKKQ